MQCSRHVKNKFKSDPVQAGMSDAGSNQLEVTVRVRFSWSRTTGEDYVIVKAGLGLAFQGNRGKVTGQSCESEKSECCKVKLIDWSPD